jgi:hypothetical protein
LADWLDGPLYNLGSDPSLVTVRHEKLTKEDGAYIANSCMRTLRAVYNYARKVARTLPADNPVSAIDWNAKHRRNTALVLSDLEEWFTQLAALKNPVRRKPICSCCSQATALKRPGRRGSSMSIFARLSCTFPGRKAAIRHTALERHDPLSGPNDAHWPGSLR